MYATLISASNDEEVSTLRDGRTKSTSGSVVSSLYRLKDTSGKDGAFFVFPDLSVRMEGRYRLKVLPARPLLRSNFSQFTLFEVINSEIHFCACTVSSPFGASSCFPHSFLTRSNRGFPC
jgi:hypothetical protein